MFWELCDAFETLSGRTRLSPAASFYMPTLEKIPGVKIGLWQAASNCGFESRNKLRLQFEFSNKVGLARHRKLMYLQHSPLDDHLLRIYLIKTLSRKNLMGKKSIAKEKEYNIIVFLQVP